LGKPEEKRGIINREYSAITYDKEPIKVVLISDIHSDPKYKAGTST
jgi:hypothetical protein